MLFRTSKKIEVGLVLTLWRGVRKPKQSISEVAINSLVAFRAVVLTLPNPDSRARVGGGMKVKGC